MDRLPLYQINAFTQSVFGGNPAGVCPLEKWLPDQLLQAIAKENNYSETAFFVAQGKHYELRWFTPTCEVDLCGHATVASAHAIIAELSSNAEVLYFETRSGLLEVTVKQGRYALNMPVAISEECAAPSNLINGLGAIPEEVYAATDYLLVFEHAEQIRSMNPDFALIQDIPRRGTIVTAPADDGIHDFVSRFFGSAAVGIKEDPVTGSAHAALTPYWSKRLDKENLLAAQISERGGELACRPLPQDRVEVTGNAVTYFKGYITLP